MKKSMKFRMIGIALCAVIFASCGGGGAGAGQQQEIVVMDVNAMSVKHTSAILMNRYPATIKGSEDVYVQPRVSGYIEQVYVDEGSLVKAGSALFKITSPETESQLRSATANVKNAKASLSTASLNVEKLRPLVEEGIIGEIQLQTAINGEESARAALAVAEANVANARAARDWATVTSPVEGVVGKINFRKGSLVNPGGEELTIISNTKTVYAYFSLNEKELLEFLNGIPGKTQAEKIKNAEPITLFLADRSEYARKGRLETISGVVNSATGSVNCRVEFANPDGILRSGGSANITIPNTLEGVIVIPQKSTFAIQDKILVYKVVDGEALQTVVEAHSMPGGQDYAVVAGLEQGDVIVVDGINSVKNGDKVSAIIK